jgi:PAS domain-containing protein
MPFGCVMTIFFRDETVLKCSLDAVVQAGMRSTSFSHFHTKNLRTDIHKDLEKNIIGWNNAAENTFGYVEQDIMGKPLSTIFPRYEYPSYNRSSITNFLKAKQ